MTISLSVIIVNSNVTVPTVFACYTLLQDHNIITYVAVPRKLLNWPKNLNTFFWDQNVQLVIILQLYDDIMIFQYKTATLKRNRTMAIPPLPKDKEDT